MENKCWKGTEMEHMHFRKVDMCKWKKGDLRHE
jgi:hypothetical protein